MTLQPFLTKMLTFLTAGPVSGGLEISDTALRFLSSGAGLSASIRLEPGVFIGGKLKDDAAFRMALRLLREQVIGKKASGKTPINVVVSLSSINIYSQVFTLPPLEGENLEKAVDLNIKMALPSGAAETYSGWQTLHSAGDSRIEILSAFFDKILADDLTSILREERFVPLAIEPRALSITRAIKIATPNYDPKVPVIALSADTSGIDAAIIRNGNLHFDYFHSWQDENVSEQMTLDMFSAVVVRSVQQILNFYNSHWKEPLGKIFVCATGMKGDIIKIIQDNFSVKVESMTLEVSPPLSDEWFIALGSALRARIPRRDDSELSILGVDARRLFRQEQADRFLSFWRLLIPLSLSLMFVVFLISLFFVQGIEKNLRSKSVFNAGSKEEAEASALMAKATEFNRSIELLSIAESSLNPKSPVLSKLIEITGRRGITINRLNLPSTGITATLIGSALTEESVRDFKNELIITPGFREVNLPITQIRKEGSNYVFSITFLISS